MFQQQMIDSWMVQGEHQGTWAIVDSRQPTSQSLSMRYENDGGILDADIRIRKIVVKETRE